MKCSDLVQVGQGVNARHTDGRYYGAFVSRVNGDDTYDVYYTENGDKGQGVKAKHLRFPLQSERQSKFPNWHKYAGQVFYDAGTKKGECEDDPDYSLEAGEWVIDRVTTNENFVCLRIGRPFKEEDIEEFDISYCMRRIRKTEEE